MLFVLIIVCLLLAFGGLPMAPWGGWHSYGWGPSSLGLVVLLVVLVVLLLGPRW
jgi:hypothetical protein